jgi:signal transduction histidine kinase/ActR/RegA family two-component response regulator
MMSESGAQQVISSFELRVLVLPLTPADAIAIRKLFVSHKIAIETVADVYALRGKIYEGAVSVILSEEALTAHPDILIECISSQPVWSDLPILVLSRSGAESASLAPILGKLGNVSVIERPMRTTTLVSLVRSAIRARERQYQVRMHLLEQAQAEAALRESEHTERAARTEAERAGRIKDEFLATLSHELRTPLHAILGWTQIMRKNTDMPSRMAEGLVVIERNARSQAQIISDLLDMSSIISGKVRLDVQRADLASIVEAAVDTVRPAADAKGIRLHVVLDPLARPVRGDPNRLQQIFWNLLTNSVKFTPKAGRVSVSLERVNSHLEVNFADNGEGIDAAFLPHVFDRFRQADSAPDRRHGGLGLGLSIVKQLVELHGGTVSVKSAGKGMGSTFRVVLPLMALIDDSLVTATSHHPAESVYREPVADVPATSLRGFRVLVVDDEPDARALIRHLLEECDATVSTAGSADEALTILASHPPDLLISDIGMPGEDGYRLIMRVRALGDSRSKIPAIALTAYARVADRVKAIEAGYQMHLAKPVEPVELIAMVASWRRQSARTYPQP